MKIWVDIDETIAASFHPTMEHLNELSGRLIRFDELTHHNWWEITHLERPITKEETSTVFRSFETRYPNHEIVDPIDGSQEKLSRLIDQGHTLIAITGRTEAYAKEGTENWMNSHFPWMFSTIHFTNHLQDRRENKSVVCKRLGIELMIEDNLDFALDLANHGIKVYLLEKPWNKQRSESHQLIHRVKNWKEIPHNL